MRRILGALLLVALGTSPAGAQTPPKTVLERLQGAVNPEQDAFTGSWRMITSSVVEKPNGKAHHEAIMEMQYTKDAKGRVHREVIRFVKDGKDETEKIRKRLEKQDEESEASSGEKKKKRKQKEAEADFVPPDLEHRHLYVFEALPGGGAATARCAFRPAPGHEKDRGLLSGELAWNPETLDPLWLDGELLAPPGPLKEMRLRIELRRVGDILYTSRMVTDGLAKILLIKRRFHADVRFEDLRPAPTASP